MIRNFGKSRLSEAFTVVSPPIILICNDPLDSPLIEQSECEQESKLVNNFYAYITDPADEYSFCKNLLATLHSESCEFRVYGIRKPYCAGAMTFKATTFKANGIYQPLPPVTFDDTGKSRLSEEFTVVSPLQFLLTMIL